MNVYDKIGFLRIADFWLLTRTEKGTGITMILTAIGNENAHAFKHLFHGTAPDAYDLCVGAIEDNTAAAAAGFSQIGDSVFLDYIYVAPDFRRQKFATALLEETLSELKNVGIAAVHVNYPEKADDIPLLRSMTG